MNLSLSDYILHGSVTVSGGSGAGGESQRRLVDNGRKRAAATQSTRVAI